MDYIDLVNEDYTDDEDEDIYSGEDEVEPDENEIEPENENESSLNERNVPINNNIPLQIPESIRCVQQCEERLSSELILDGIAVLTKNLDILSPISEVHISKNVQYKKKEGKCFKGFKKLLNAIVIEIKFATSEYYDISILFLINIFLPLTYIDKHKLQSKVYKTTLAALRKTCRNPNKANNSIIPDFILHPGSWKEFAQEFKVQLVKEYKKYHMFISQLLAEKGINVNELNKPENHPRLKGFTKIEEFGCFPFATLVDSEFGENYEDHIFFYFSKMGQNIEIPMALMNFCKNGISVAPHSPSNQEFTRFFNPYFDSFEKDETSILEFIENTEIVFHIARDLKLPNHHLFWVADEVKKTLNLQYEEFNVMCIPGAPNLRAHQIEEDMGTITFYNRFGNQFHRSESGIFFKRPMLAQTLLTNLGTKIFTEKTATETVISKDIMDGSVSRIIRNFIGLASEDGSIARMEIVMRANLKDHGNHFSYFKLIAKSIMSFMMYVEENNLTSPTLNLPIPCEALKTWMNLTLLPCINAIDEAVDLVKNNDATLIEKIHSTWISEYIITLMLTGRSLDGFPASVRRDLGINFLKRKKCGESWVFKKISAYHKNGKIMLNTLQLDDAHLNKWLLEWMFKGKPFEELKFKSLVAANQKFRKRNQKNFNLEDILEKFFPLLVNEKNCKNKHFLDFAAEKCFENNIDNLYFEFITCDMFCILLLNGKISNFLQQAAVSQLINVTKKRFMHITRQKNESTIARDKYEENRADDSFLITMVSFLTDQIISRKKLFFVKIENSKVFVILPVNQTKILSQNYKLSCPKVVLKALKVICKEDTKSENFSSFSQICNIVENSKIEISVTNALKVFFHEIECENTHKEHCKNTKPLNLNWFFITLVKAVSLKSKSSIMVDEMMKKEMSILVNLENPDSEFCVCWMTKTLNLIENVYRA